MKSLEMDLLFPGEKPCAIRYKPIKLYHPVAGVSYGLEGKLIDENGQTVGTALLPDISCDYIFVSRLAVKCTAAQLDPEQLLEMLDRFLFSIS